MSLSKIPKIKLYHQEERDITDIEAELEGQELTKYELDVIQNSVKDVYETFIKHVSNGRGISLTEVDKIVKSIPTEERKKLWGMGIKIGRYHIYLPKMLKPKAVEFRISLWKLFYNISDKNKIPKSGLNFLTGTTLEKNFLLLCGFEKFNEFFVRIDMLEKLFLKMIENTKDKKFKVNANMMNLLGCSKENFYKLMTNMNYKKDKTADTYIFKGEKRKREKIIRFDKKENPFNKLLSLNIK